MGKLKKVEKMFEAEKFMVEVKSVDVEESEQSNKLSNQNIENVKYSFSPSLKAYEYI